MDAPPNLIQQHVDRLSALPAPELVSPGREAELLLVLRSLGFVEDSANLGALAGRIALALLDGDPVARRRSGLLGRTLLASLEGSAQAAVTSAYADPLRTALLEEEDPQVLDALPALVGAWSRLAVQQGHWPMLGKLHAEAVAPRLLRPGTPPAFAEQLKASLKGIGGAEKERILAMLQAAPSRLIRAIRPAVLSIGGAAVEDLGARIFVSGRPEEARRAATILGKLDAPAAEALARELPAGGTSARGRRLLEVIDALAPPNLASTLAACLDHADPGVRAAAASALLRLGRGYALVVSRSVLAAGGESAAGLEVLRIARALELRELVPDLVRIATSTRHVDRFEAAIRALAAFPVAAALPAFKAALGKPAASPPADLARRLRSLAAAACAKIDTPEARQLAAKEARDLGDSMKR